jgi:ketosteroid isomerase-like protein
MADMDDLARLVAYEDIRQLVARYALAIDARDLDTLVGLFVDRGRDRLRASFDESLRGIGATILNVGTHVIDLVDDGHATGHVYCKGEIQDGERWIHQAILYRDTYERSDGRWYFVSRDHQLWYGAEVGMNPLRLPAANWPEHHDGMGTVPECWDTWRAFWERGVEGTDGSAARPGGDRDRRR